ncbi:enoyl-CoA hydratase/isomerase family protein [Nesterenkonia populi]
MAEQLVNYELIDGCIASIELNNPPLNLITNEMNMELHSALDAAEKDPDVRVVLLSGAGDRAFSAGSDARVFPRLQKSVGLVEGKLRYENQVYDKLDELSKPSIGLLKGVAMGGGLELSLCCDFRIASEDARIGLPEVRLGMLPGSGAIHRLPRLVGEALAKEMMYLGAEISSADAHRRNLVNKVVPADQILTAARNIAADIAHLPQGGIQRIKSLVQVARTEAPERVTELTLRSSEEAFSSPDATEGLIAFFEKRTPKFNR